MYLERSSKSLNDVMVGNCSTTTAAKLYMNTVIIRHLTYCMTNLTQAKVATLKLILSLYKQALKVLDINPIAYHD